MSVDGHKRRVLRVGKMPYLNSVLFYQAMDGRFDLLPMVPTVMAEAARRGEVDAGPVPLLDALALQETFEPLGGFCIATKTKAHSILLFSMTPIEGLDGKTIAVTGETSTSARLLKVLLTFKYRIKPARYVGPTASAEALLLIGDSALRERKGVAGKPHVYDLGEIWQQWTGLPTVFALWISRKGLSGGDQRALAAGIANGLGKGLDALPDAKAGRPDLHMSGAEVREYLEGFNFLVGPQESQSVKEFTRLVGQLEDASIPGK